MAQVYTGAVPTLTNLVQGQPEAEEMPTVVLGGPATALLDGYDSISGELRASALTASTLESGTSTTAHIAVCEGMTELTEALNIDQSLAIEFGEVGKVDEKVEFSRKQKATTESLSVVVHVRHQVKTVTAKEPKFKVAVDPGKLADFVTEHGDSYVDSVTLGGEYYAVYTFHTQTTEEQRKLKVDLEGKGVKAGNSIEAKVMVELDNFAKRTETAWTFDQRLSGVSAQLPKQEEITDFALRFPTMDFSRPVVIDRSIARYENVAGFPAREAFAPVIDNRDYFVGSGSGALVRTLVKLGARKNKVDWIQAIHATYGYKGDTKLADLKKDLETDREVVREQLNQYRKNPLTKFTRPPLPSVAKGTPVLQYDKGFSSQWGGSPGYWQFNYPSVEQALQLRMRLSSLQLRTSNYVDKITMFYSHIHGVWGPCHFGGDGGGGSDQHLISLDSNEWVKRVDLRHGGLIDRLKITTTAGITTEGGGSGGTEASFEAKDGQVILGFQGSGHVDIHTLQVVWVKLKDCIYV